MGLKPFSQDQKVENTSPWPSSLLQNHLNPKLLI
jgi:hypothetical protein